MNARLTIEVDSPNARPDALQDLEEWLNGATSLKDATLEPVRAAAKPGTMGLDPVTALSIVLSSAAVVELAKSLHAWIKARRPRVVLRIRKGDSHLTIDATNVLPQERLIEMLTEWLDR